ncbi:MAG: YdcF family protein, partial [Methylobacterium sp.]|nr:YdcF family protein [Methylobacterium sp.]
LLEAGHGRRLLISGVNIQVTSEQLRKIWPGHEAAFECCIDLDFRARNTIENARESARWVRKNGFGAILLVTASYHMPRARLEFAEVLPGVTIEPYPVVPDRSRIEDWWRAPALVRLLASEYTKFLLTWLRAAVIDR